MKTVAHKNIHNWWDGKVIIDEVREYIDDRGSLTELWRTDDEVMCEDPYCPQMSYWSITKPYVMRGMHQHSMAQCDWFYTFKSKMVYQLYNEETKEMRCYFTNPNAITRVKVSPPIIHGYRSLENRDIVTANFPSSLFMGENKKEPIDEIRWEDKFKDVPVVFIFGANGRLGKALTKSFFDNMGFCTYEVVPCYEKLNSVEEVSKLFKTLEALFKGRKLYFFNCAALTNVQDKNTLFDIWEWANAKMPSYMANYCVANDWKFIGFSTDYIYQNSEETKNNYTLSKKLFEKLIETNSRNDGISILRVANLYSKDPNDVHNAIIKFCNVIKSCKEATIDPKLSIFPTNVEILSFKIVGLFKNSSFDHMDCKYFNIIPKKYKLDNFISTFFPNTPIKTIDSKLTPWDIKFETDKEPIKLNIGQSENAIQNIISLNS